MTHMGRLVHALLATAAAVLIAAPTASAVFPGRNGVLATWGFCGNSTSCTGPKIKFVTAHGHFAGTLDPQNCRDGSDTGTGTVDCNDTDPAWSPDGRRLAFVRDDAIWVAGRDGSDLHAVPGTSGNHGAAPAWSADGKRLVFNRGSGLAVIDATGGTPVQILTSGHGASWSSSNRIAFARGSTGHENLFIVRPDGSHLRRLTSRGGSEPNWSPHASRLAFTRDRHVWTVHADGTHARRLIRLTSTAPVWSPDGHAIAFEGAFVFDGTPDLYVARLDRLSRPWKIGTSNAFDWQPRL